MGCFLEVLKLLNPSIIEGSMYQYILPRGKNNPYTVIPWNFADRLFFNFSLCLDSDDANLSLQLQREEYFLKWGQDISKSSLESQIA